MAAWNSGKVVKQKQWSRNLYSLYVESEIEPFTAGQFIKIGLTIEGEVVGRPYSLVNAPGIRPLEFYYIQIPNGKLTSRLATLKAGDDILVAPRAHGFLTLDEVPISKHLWMMATGTAVGPFLSILATDQLWQRYERVILVYAVRTNDDLSYQDEIHQLLVKYQTQFIYIPFVSRDKNALAMTGRIPQAIDDGRLEQRAGLTITPENSQMMLCGNPQMVKDTLTSLTGRGLIKNRRVLPGQITMENYW
ncbi:MAG: ferredoxin--NADP reductase [Methylophilus sp.]